MPERFGAEAPAGSSSGFTPLRILAYGDSLTAGFYDNGLRFEPYGRTLADTIQQQQQGMRLQQQPVQVWVCGLSGATAQEMVEQVDSDEFVDVIGRTGQGIRRILQEQGPFHLAVIMAGTNDLANFDGAEDVSSSIQKLHGICHAVALRTIALAVPPSRVSCTHNRFGKYRKTVNSCLETWAAATNGLATFVETESLVPWTHGSDMWEDDGLHLSPVGSSVLGCKLAPLVCARLPPQAQLPLSLLPVQGPQPKQLGESLDSQTKEKRFSHEDGLNKKDEEQKRVCCGNRGSSKGAAEAEEREASEEEDLSEDTYLQERGPMPQRFCPRPNGSHTVLSPTKRILAFGDSLTAGYYLNGFRFAPYGAALAEALLPEIQSEVWVCGLSGLTAREMAVKKNARQLQDVCHRHGKGLKRILSDNGPFDIVLIMAGTNDLARNDASQAEAVIADIKALHAACHAVGVRTIALGIPPRDAVVRDTSYCRYWESVNKRLENWAHGTEGIATFIDTAVLIPFASNGFWEHDGLHLSKAGSRHLGKKLAPALRSLLQSPPPEHISKRRSFCSTA